MDRVSSLVVRRRRAVILLTALMCAVFGVLSLFVRVNYDMGDYLPAYTPTTQAMGLVQTRLPNLSLYVPGLSLREAAEEKQAIAGMPGVEGVLWLDDAMDIRSRPEATLDAAAVSRYYNEGPLYRLIIDEATQSATVQELRERYPDALMSGVAYGLAQIINVTMKEVSSLMLIVAPLCILILLAATRHWAEPLLFLLAIGAAIVLNEGSNIIFGSVSYITRACSALLQLAVSIDYAIFLLHSFDELRDTGMETHEAMRQAMRRAAPSIASSAMTTVFGFLALTLMDFRLGMDLGLVLAKGVLFSYLCVMFFLPACTVASVRLLDRTRHRSFLPDFRGFGRFVTRRMGPVALAVLLVLPVAFLAQRSTRFLYGTGGMHSEDSPVHTEKRAIEEVFGSGRMAMVLVPEGDRAREAGLARALRDLPRVASVISYSDAVSLSIPPEVLPPRATEAFYEGGYARLIVSLDTDEESDEAFEATRRLRETAAAYYPGEGHVIGETAVNEDLMSVITRDTLKVLLAGILSIGIVLLINFRNLTIPLILLVIIQGSIWL
ncbi:MAG TPA: MMPL family transporter, partial [Candidatus Limnocylindria bacterium]|nr:MMPL family transporter [Candidatus Limnocylindria bacterium]